MTDANLDDLIRALGQRLATLVLRTADLPACDATYETRKQWHRVLTAFHALQDAWARRP